MPDREYGTGAEESPYDVRTFTYVPTGIPSKGGERYLPEDIEDQHRVGICTAISLTQNARKALGIKFSADFQYLIQKTEFDKNWREGSSISTALKVAHKVGLLPESEWTFTKEKHRKLSYQQYIEKLQAVPPKEIERLKKIAAKYKIKAYASVAVDRDLMAQAIVESEAGILTRYAIDKQWWSGQIEPLRKPTGENAITGHAVTDCNYNGSSFRVANTWGTDWADKGTAYRLQKDYKPTEAWQVYYNEVPGSIQKKLDKRTALQGQLLDKLQELVELLKKQNANT
jgi:hypothetical protein